MGTEYSSASMRLIHTIYLVFALLALTASGAKKIGKGPNKKAKPWKPQPWLTKLARPILNSIKEQQLTKKLKKKLTNEKFAEFFKSGEGCVNAAGKTKSPKECVCNAKDNDDKPISQPTRLMCVSRFAGVKSCSCEDGFTWSTMPEKPKGGKKKQLQKKPKGRPHHKPIINKIPKKLREKSSWLKKFKKSYNQMMAMKKKKKAEIAGWLSKFKTNFKKMMAMKKKKKADK